MTNRILLCMKYGTKYPADYVNVLYNACKKAARTPHRFVCLTNDAAGLLPEIEAMPIPDVGLRPEDWFRGGIWPKIALMDASLQSLNGRCLFIDLDMLVLRDLDAFFDVQGTLIGVNGSPAWGRPGHVAPPELMSCLISFEAGALSHIADKFRSDPQAAMSNHRTEQVFIEAQTPDLTFWPDGWVVSFKRRLRRPLGLDLVLPPAPPPPEAKVLAFHGKPSPIYLIKGKPYFWDRFPHLGHGKVGWMRDYWVDNGGAL